MRHRVSVLNFGINARIFKRLLDLQLRRHHFSSLANSSNKPSVDSPSRKWNIKRLWITGLGALAVSVGGIAHARISRPKSNENAGNLNVVLDESKYIEVPSLESGFSGEMTGIYEQHLENFKTPWKLVTATRSNDSKIRKKGICALAKLQNLHVSCCQQIAQCLDMRASVGLARTAGSDLQMLLLPPKYHEKFDLRIALYDLLTRLPIGSVDQCVHHITVSTLRETFRNVENLNSEANYYGEITSGHLRSVPLKEVVKMCLQALLIHSTIPSHREEIVRLNGIRLLSEIKSMWPTSVTICSMIAQIIGSLALETSSHKQLFQSGWIRVLAEWLRSTQLNLSLPAARALLNMDNEGVYGKIKLEHGIYVAHPLTRDGEDEITGDAIFVHGLLGGAFRTWRQMDPGKDKSEAAPQIQQEKDESILPEESTISCYTRCWPKDWLAKDTPHVRILLVDYETHLSRWTEKCPLEGERRSLDLRSVEMLNKLRQAGVGHQPAIWITHSMGGLLVKKLLLFSCNSNDVRHQDVCHKTKGVVFFSVPHKGASLPYLWKETDYLLLPSTEVRELKPGSKHLLQLHVDFKGLVEDRGLSCLSFGEELRVNILGKRVSTVLVPPDVADPGFGEFHVVPVNHLYICKPSSRRTQLYQRLENYIRHHLKDASQLKPSTDELDAEIVMSTFPF